MSKLEAMSVEQLEGKLRATKAIRLTIGIIFAVIILAWIVMGYWRTNIPVFVSTVVMGLSTVGVTSIGPVSIAAEINRRKQKGQ